MPITKLHRRRDLAGSDGVSALRPILGLLKDVSQACATTMTPEAATSACLEIVARFTGWQIAHAFRRRTDDGAMATMRTWFIAPSMDLPSARAFMTATESFVLAPGAGLVGRVAAEGRPMACPDVTENPQFLRIAAARASGVKGCFAFPVVVEGRVEVVLEFFSCERAELDDAVSEAMIFVVACLAGTMTRAEHVRVLDAALAHMAQGLLMLDTDSRMIVCNDAYRDLFGFTADFARPGVSLSELIARSGAHDTRTLLSADETAAGRRALFARGTPFSLQFAVRDGRVIEAIYNPMRGGGWVATYIDVTARQEAEARLAHMARHDALTGLPNRTLFNERMVETLAEASARPPQPDDPGTAVLCLDLDRFKAVNDALGHDTGDALLREVTRRAGSVIAGSAATLSRLGGDEFALLIPRVRPEQAGTLAKRLIDAVGQGYEIDGQRVDVGLSVGISLSPGDGHDSAQLLRAADMALYRAKAEGRGTFRFFEPEMDARMKARRRLELDLRQALATGQFELHYQPLVSLDTDRISAFEALVRWRHPTRGLVPPADFIPLAEEIALIVPLGEWVLREACREAATWSGDVRVAINLSPVQFQSADLVATVASALAEAELDPRRLELEITEGVLLQNSEATLAILHRIKALGVRIAMDDFGTGYSSLGYLRTFPFDKIKIDRSFIADIATRADAVAIVRAVTSLGASLGIATVAEGIETAEQLERLRAEGCTEVQGYLFSRPTPAHTIMAMLAYDRDEARASAASRTAVDPGARGGPAEALRVA